MTGPKIASELTVSNSESELSSSQFASLSLEATGSPTSLSRRFAWLAQSPLLHAYYFLSFPLDSKNGSNPVTAEADSFACSAPPG